jgi:hypothetical protein
MKTLTNPSFSGLSPRVSCESVETLSLKLLDLFGLVVFVHCGSCVRYVLALPAGQGQGVAM